jgi:DMSO/TMAO reductase YedYZ molybdopterin-dependent catalytic subunit
MANESGRIPTADPLLGWQEALDAGLVGLSREPLNCEVPPDLLNADVTPTRLFFRRNHFGIPQLDESAWRLEIGGLVQRSLRLSLAELKQLGSESIVAVLECAGNGRNLYIPSAQGERWGLGAVGNAKWTGVPLADVLHAAGVLHEAVEVVFRGADQGIANGSGETIAFERSLTVHDAMHSGALLAFAMNDERLPTRHGYPVRLLVPGKYAVASVKWLTSIAVSDRPFDGFFQAEHYVFEWLRDGKIVRQPVAEPQVRALITAPATGDHLPQRAFKVRGVAWSGRAPVTQVAVGVAGDDWQPARLVDTPNPASWQRWEKLVEVARPGEATIRACATDHAGRTQPVQPEWNRLGYGGNFIHEIAVRVELAPATINGVCQAPFKRSASSDVFISVSPGRTDRQTATLAAREYERSRNWTRGPFLANGNLG